MKCQSTLYFYCFNILSVLLASEFIYELLINMLGVYLLYYLTLGTIFLPVNTVGLLLLVSLQNRIKPLVLLKAEQEIAIL